MRAVGLQRDENIKMGRKWSKASKCMQRAEYNNCVFQSYLTDEQNIVFCRNHQLWENTFAYRINIVFIKQSDSSRATIPKNSFIFESYDW